VISVVLIEGGFIFETCGVMKVVRWFVSQDVVESGILYISKGVVTRNLFAGGVPNPEGVVLYGCGGRAK